MDFHSLKIKDKAHAPTHVNKKESNNNSNNNKNNNNNNNNKIIK